MQKKKKKKTPPMPQDTRGLLFIAFAFLGLLALCSFHQGEPSKNLLGHLGYFVSYGSHFLFGLSSFLLPAYLIWMALCILTHTKRTSPTHDHFYFAILLVSLSFLFTAISDQFPSYALSWGNKVLSETIEITTSYSKTLTRSYLGGVPAYFLYADIPFFYLKRVLSPQGTLLIFSSLFLVSFFLLTRLEINPILKAFAKVTKQAFIGIYQLLKKSFLSLTRKELISKPELKKTIKIHLPDEKKKKTPTSPLTSLPTNKTIGSFPQEPIIKTSFETPKKEEIVIPTKSLSSQKESSLFSLPDVSLLLSPNPKVDQPTLKRDLMRQAAILEETLKSFGIDAKVGEIHSGPTITSFEVHPSIGVKVQKIKALENDIALNMEAKSIRIVAPIPGKAAVGVEVPAIHPQEVNFKEMLIYYQQKGKKLQIPILLGKAVNGDWVFSDLAKMPHLLIAGATGSGKSVCINTIVMSILMNATPDEVKLLMVDPKKVELTQYSQLPHMIAPVITEAHGAYAALQWLVKEMQVRYEILKQLALRNISAFNTRKRNLELEASLQMPIPEKMPFIVAIVDEFADLMMVSSADLETPIARIAQMARAVGIHLILATQRPSREVITGIIKANIPTRISFKVASRINSQIILDETGAESLLGNGDLLFLPPGSSQLLRAQGVYISDEEIHRTIEALAKQGEPQYLISSFDTYRPIETESDSPKEGKDALYDQALSIVLGAKMASTTFLQRKLKIGYARAASLMDELEENGIIGPQEGAKPRRILSSLQPSLDEDDALS